MADRVTEIITYRNNLRLERYNFENRWQEIGNLMFPLVSEVTTTRTPGESRRTHMLTNAPELAGERFATGMHNLTSGEGRPWFYLKASNERLNRVRSVKEWLEEATRVLYVIFNSPRSNYHQAIHEYWLQEGFFGTSPVFITDRPGEMPLFQCAPLPECYIDRNHDNRIDVILRSYKKTAKQILQEFPEAQKYERVTQAYQKGKTDRFNCLHAIQPRKDWVLGSLGPRGQRWESVYILEDEKAILAEGGYQDFPAVCSRWSVAPNEIYGRGPGDRALPDARMLTEAVRSAIKARQLVVDPPMEMTDGGYTAKLKSWPGAHNMLNPGMLGAKPIHTIDPGGLMVADQQQVELREAIKEAFYHDLFKLPPSLAPDGDVNHASATEFIMRRQEQAAELSPLFSRQKTEMQSPLIERTLNIAARNGMLPPPPEQIRDADVIAEYVSPLAMAQQTGEVAIIVEGLQTVGMVESIVPGAADVLRGDQIARRVLDSLGFPIEGIFTEEQVSEKRADEAQQQQVAEQAALAESQASAGLDAAKARAALVN